MGCLSPLAHIFRAKHSSHSKNKKTSETAPTHTITLPRPSSQFISYLDKHPQTPTRKLLRPYLSYEAQLRQEFVRADTEIDDLANLVPIYNGQEDELKIRTIDRQVADSEKYLLPLKDHQREVDGSLSIAPSLEDYRTNFEGFTHGQSNYTPEIYQQLLNTEV